MSFMLSFSLLLSFRILFSLLMINANQPSFFIHLFFYAYFQTSVLIMCIGAIKKKNYGVLSIPFGRFFLGRLQILLMQACCEWLTLSVSIDHSSRESSSPRNPFLGQTALAKKAFICHSGQAESKKLCKNFHNVQLNVFGHIGFVISFQVMFLFNRVRNCSVQ